MQRQVIVKLVLFWCLFSSNNILSQNTKEWKVWVKTSPCSGRNDWISVAKEFPAIGGLGFFELADIIFPSSPCTRYGCSFEEATAVANSLRISDEFFDYCCRDYSVWEHSQTRARSVVLGKFGTAGYEWIFVKGDLCCEEAEVLAGLSNVCNGNVNNQQVPDCPNIYPNSYAAWDAGTSQYLCYCNQGYVWNATRTACVSSQQVPDCPNIYANSYAAWDASTSQYLCYCKDGYDWNATRTACVSKQQVPDCPNIYANSYAAWDASTSQYLCYCKDGYEWNTTRTACVSKQQALDCPNIYANSYAAWDASTSQYLCYCNQGYDWNATRTACVSKQQVPDCPNIYPNSYAAWDASTSQYLCYCKDGYEWNSTNTACIEPKKSGSGCQQSDVATFSKMAGSWKSYTFHINIGGSCDNVTGTWKAVEYCEGVEETYNSALPRITGPIKGKMNNGTLELSFESPPRPGHPNGTNGTAYCTIKSDGTISCSGFPCSSSSTALKKQ